MHTSVCACMCAFLCVHVCAHTCGHNPAAHESVSDPFELELTDHL